MDQLILTLIEQGKQACKTEGDRRRYDRAREIIERRDYARIDDTHYHVRSSSSERWYEVNGACECEDATIPSATSATDGWCKHRLAVGIIKRARKLRGTVCPVCLESLDCADFKVAGCYRSYIFCPSMNNDHYSAEWYDHDRAYPERHQLEAA